MPTSLLTPRPFTGFFAPQVAHCKMPKKPSLEKKHKKDDDSKSGGGWGPSGGDWPSGGGGDYPSGGGGDYPGPGGGGMGQGCMALKSRKKCLKVCGCLDKGRGGGVVVVVTTPGPGGGSIGPRLHGSQERERGVSRNDVSY
jgi:hypothetical protein